MMRCTKWRVRDRYKADGRGDIVVCDRSRSGARDGGAQRAGLVLLLLTQLSGGAAIAQVTRFEVLSVAHNALGGMSFDPVGPYDLIKARATVAVDPADSRNAAIADLGRAPRNAAGKVEAISDVEILTPADAKRRNGKIFYEALNRGRKLALGVFDDAAASNSIATAADAGNGYLLRQGYTLVWSGWQGDIDSDPGTLALSVPTLAGVTGRTTTEFVFDSTKSPIAAALPYPAAEFDTARLTVQSQWNDTATTPADLSFRSVDPSRVEITRPAGFDGGTIFRLDYLARDPKVLGLGFAATRDIVAFLIRDPGPQNPLAGKGRETIHHAYAYGESQAGRFLREFLYLGFNEDRGHRLVFDGILVHIGGARFTGTNERFGLADAIPGHPLSPGSIADRFPFAYSATTDPLTGVHDGLLERCTASRTCPKIIQVDSGYEWYHSRESLLLTDPTGKPLSQPSNVRLFDMAATPHVPLPKAPLCVMASNPLHHGPIMRAMLHNLDAWVDQGVAPPPSRIPTLADGMLVAADEAAHQLPLPIPGLPYTGMHVVAAAEDLTSDPPKILGYFKLYLPRLDADGMMVGGVRLPAVTVPKATYTGWNPHVPGDGPSTLCNLVGGVVPFAHTREERLKNGDPRPSLEERYPSQSAYVEQVDKAAQALVHERLMLPEDLERQHAAAANDTLAELRAP
jgi:hypothetical protein